MQPGDLQRPEEPPRTRENEPVGFARFPLFDAARAIAVLLVVGIHAAGPAGIGTSGVSTVVGQFDVGVTIFFLISGFLLYRPFSVTHAEGAAQPTTGAYMWRRLLRIVPAYWVALTAAAVLLNLSGVFSFHGLATYYGFGQIYQRDTISGGLPQAWSLDVEIAFYAFLPIYAFVIWRLLRTGRDWFRVELAGIAALVLASTVYKAAFVLSSSAGELPPVPLRFLPTYLDQFALGMALAVISVWALRSGQRPRALRIVDRHAGLPWLGALAALVIVSALNLSPFYTSPPLTEVLGRHWLHAAIALGVLLPVAFGDPKRGWVRRLLGLRPVLYIGTISYGIYLWHRPLIEWLQDIGLSLGLGWDAYAAWLPLAILVSVVVAAASWHLIERPILTLKRLVPDRGRRQRPEPDAGESVAAAPPLASPARPSE